MMTYMSLDDVHVPKFSAGIVYGHIGSNGDVSNMMSMLAVEIVMWLLPAARLLQLYVATLVKKIFYGQAGCLGQDVHKASELEIAHLYE